MIQLNQSYQRHRWPQLSSLIIFLTFNALGLLAARIVPCLEFVSLGVVHDADAWVEG